MTVHENELLSDLGSVDFLVGAKKLKWSLCGISFPYVLFRVSAAIRQDGPPAFLLRSECSGYPGIAPTSQLWHGGKNVSLPEDCKPKDDRNQTVLAFKEWQSCLYHPVDRIAWSQHPEWHSQYPGLAWKPSRGIVFLLETVYDLVNSTNYFKATICEEALSVPAEYLAQDS
jgi:hypothetical protein